MCRKKDFVLEEPYFVDAIFDLWKDRSFIINGNELGKISKISDKHNKMRNEIEFPSKRDASNLRKTILEFVQKHPKTYCLSYEWMLGIVQPKTESEYIQNMYRFSTQGVVRRCDLYLRKPVTHGGKQYVLRLESYGDSKKTRMQAGVNPLAYSFGKIMLDYVYLFLEEKSDSLKEKMIERIEKQAEKERYYTALQNIQAYEDIFEDKSLQERKATIEKKFQEAKGQVSSMQQSIKNMQINITISKSNPSLSNPNAETNQKPTKQQFKVQEDEEADDASDDFEDDLENDEDDDEEEEMSELDSEEEEKLVQEHLKQLKKQRKEEKQKQNGKPNSPEKKKKKISKQEKLSKKAKKNKAARK